MKLKHLIGKFFVLESAEYNTLIFGEDPIGYIATAEPHDIHISSEAITSKVVLRAVKKMQDIYGATTIQVYVPEL